MQNEESGGASSATLDAGGTTKRVRNFKGGRGFSGTVVGNKLEKNSRKCSLPGGRENILE